MNINNVYFPTWTEGLDWGDKPGESELANIPKYITHVTLSFLRPDTPLFDINSKMDTIFYDGSVSLYKLKEEISFCKLRGGNNRTVLASVGGEIAGNFENVNFSNLVNSISELGLDGIDIDYEPNGVMTESDLEVEKYIELISTFRYEFNNITKRTGKKYLISCAPTGIGLLKNTNFEEYKNKYSNISDRLKEFIPESEQFEELNFGSLSDENTFKQPNFNVGTVGSAFNFGSAGKMKDVFCKKNTNCLLNDYQFIGQMVDIVFYQAYNIGSGNTLAKILCYETHRELSDYFNKIDPGSGFVIGHGSHVGKEAWPHYSYTKKRIGYIYSYINKYGRDGDGASFWSYSSSIIDDSLNVPSYGMGYREKDEVFKHVGDLLNI